MSRRIWYRRLMDVDLALIRTFTLIADNRSFSKAALQAGVSQQALSKRTRKLEKSLGQPLFVRSTRSVMLTQFGRQFLPTARDLLLTAEKIDLLLITTQEAPARVDVLEEQLAPMALVRNVTSARQSLRVQASSRRTFENSIRGLLSGELDMAFGRIFDGGPELSPDLRSEIARVEPLVAIVSTGHPLCREESITPGDLARFGIWTPGPGAPDEWTDFLYTFCRTFNIDLFVENVSGTDVGHIVSHAAPPPDTVFISGMDVLNPEGSDVHLIPIRSPTPVYTWWLVASAYFERPQAEDFLQTFREVRDSREWAFIGDDYWLAPADRTLSFTNSSG